MIIAFIIVYATLVNGITGMIGVFIAGLLVDLWNGRLLGVSSLVYVTIVFLLNMYRRKFYPEHLVFLLPFTLAVVSIVVFIESNMQFNHQIIKDQLLSAGAGLVFMWGLVRLWQYRFAKKQSKI